MTVGDRNGGLAPPAFLDSGGPARAAPEVVETRPANGSLPYHLYRFDAGRVQQEGPLYADLVGDAAHGERGVGPSSPASYHDALENLRPSAFTLGDADADAYGVAGLELFDLRVRVGLYELPSFHSRGPQ